MNVIDEHAIKRRNAAGGIASDGARAAQVQPRQGRIQALGDRAMDRLDGLLERGDVLMTLGAGDVDRVGSLWLESAS